MLIRLSHPKQKMLAMVVVSVLLFQNYLSLGQNLPGKTISITANNIPLQQLLEDIQKKSGVTFSYNPKKIPADQTISYTATNKSLQTVLNEVTAKAGLEYVLVENQIILKPGKKVEKAPAPNPNATYSGYIKDAGSGEALIGASVYVKELQTGTTTNPFGFFSLTIPKGAYTASISYVGYEEIAQPLELNHSFQQNVVLRESTALLEEVEINTSTSDPLADVALSKIDLKPLMVQERPSYFGEVDVVKSLESVPGVKLHSDGSTFYYVRGGNRDQNLILMDDAPVYNPNHLLGIFSNIIPDAANDITLYKGDMPISMGGRLSSILDIRTKKGNDQHFRAWGTAGIISTKVGIEGPIKKDASSYLVSFRGSRLKWLTDILKADVKKFNFYDLTAKVNVRLTPRNRLYFSFYNGGDNYFGKNNGISWSNTALSMKWNKVITDRLFLNTTLAGGGYDYFLYTDVANNTRWNSHISNFTFKNDLSYFLRPDNEITMGMSLSAYGFNPGNVQSNLKLTDIPTLSVKNSGELVIYGGHDFSLGDKWKVNYGVRLVSWTNSGESYEFVFDRNHNVIDTLNYNKGQNYSRYTLPELRMNLSYQLDDRSQLKAGAARNVQNLHLITNSASPFTSLEVWLPSSINIKPQTSNQYSVGYFRDEVVKGVNVSVEGYYKTMQHQIDYAPHAETLLNPLLEGQLRFGNAKSYGLEITAKKETGRLRGLAGYTYSRAQRKFADINDGRAYNAFYDRPNQVNVQLSYDLTNRWNLGMNFIYYTGAPYSAPVSFYYYNGEQVPLYAQKNNARLPDYHRMDLSANFRLNKNPESKYQHHLAFSIYNVYGHKNLLFVNYTKTETSDGFKIPSNLLTQDRTLSQSYLYSFTPSVSYNFKWR